MTQIASTRKRRGMTLMEVILSLAIFMVAIAALAQLISMASDFSLAAQWRQEGVFLCKSKLAEFAAGALPLESQPETPFEGDDAAWTWSCNCEVVQQDLPVLWRVEVTVKRERPYRPPLLVRMAQYIVDPADRGSTLDPPPVTAEEEAEAASGDSSSSSGGSASSGSGNGGGGGS